MKTITADVLFTPESSEFRFLPEGPIDLGQGQFSWVAIQHGADAEIGSLNVYDSVSDTHRCSPLSGRPGFALPTDQPGQFLVGLERRIERFDLTSGQSEVICEGIDSEVENTIVNDGVRCAAGIIFGTKHLKFSQTIASLYFFRTRDQQLFPLCGGQICSNGKVVLEDSHDRVTFLDIDTPTKKVVRYRLDVEAGALSPPETVLDLNEVSAFPDGMVGTPDGRGIIISFYNPEPAEFGETRLYALDSGECEILWQTPASPQNTCPLLFEREGTTQLVITTAVEHMSPARQAVSTNAGSLFIAAAPLGHETR